MQFVKRKIKEIGVFAGIILLVCMATACSKGRAKEVSAILIESMVPSVRTSSIGGVENVYSVNAVEITSQESDESTGMTTVICEMDISTAELEADVECYVYCRYIDGGWGYVDSMVTAVRDMRPLQGAEESTEILESSVQGLYPNINWGFYQNNFIGEDIVYDFPISWSLVEHNTDLAGKKDQYVYDYSFVTNTVLVSGKCEINYNFTQDGVWTVGTTNCLEDSVLWNLEGIWSFDILTFYVDVCIQKMDFEKQVATIQRRGSAFQGGGDIVQEEIGFREEEGCIYFDTFVIPGSMGTDKEIILTAKMDDLYYTSEIFSGNPVESPIGGKSEE